MIEDKVDGIDLNLGCPQECAKRGNYGAFLLDDVCWNSRKFSSNWMVSFDNLWLDWKSIKNCFIFIKEFESTIDGKNPSFRMGNWDCLVDERLTFEN